MVVGGSEEKSKQEILQELDEEKEERKNCAEKCKQGKRDYMKRDNELVNRRYGSSSVETCLGLLVLS